MAQVLQLINTEISSFEDDRETLEGSIREEREGGKSKDNEGDQVSLLAVLFTVLRKSWASCNTNSEDIQGMEIGIPTDVRHVAHVTFDRFNGFLGLPVEFEPEIPRRPPSASTSVFGVSTESMQLSFDSRGNSVPTILLLMQCRLYAQGGLQAEGIFRINAENSQEELVRDQLNCGVVPDGVDIHCLAGLIKAWFRELPSGVLDSLSPEQVMQSQSEEECACLARLLPPTEASLLDWSINLMADVAQLEALNKMNARNVAMVFAPNMTHMADPLTALMYAVQVMNFLKTLIVRTLRGREECILETPPASSWEPFDDNGHQSCSNSYLEAAEHDNYEKANEHVFVSGEPLENISSFPDENISTAYSNSFKARTNNGSGSANVLEDIIDFNGPKQETRKIIRKRGLLKKGNRAMGYVEKSSLVSRLNSCRTERVEAWR